VAVRVESLLLHARSLRMRHHGAAGKGIYSVLLFGQKLSLAPATAWQQPGTACRRLSPVSWRSAWADGARASA
jgi:hypothetical protein